MWAVVRDHSNSTSREMIEPMRAALDEEKCETILWLKAAMRDNPNLTCPSFILF